MASSPIVETLFTFINRRHTLEPEDEKSLHEMLVFESMKDGDSQVRIKLPGIPNTSRPRLITVDRRGKFVEAPQTPVGAHGLPSGFVLGGDIKLFGMELPARIYTFHGELSKASNVREMVTIGERILLKQLLNGLSGTLFGDVSLKNPSFTFQEAVPESGKTRGLYFKAEVLFEGALAGVYDILKTVFGLGEYLSLSVAGFVASTREWTKPLAPPEMALSGTILGVKAKIGDLLTFTSVGVELTAIKSAEKVNNHSNYHCMAGFFGTVDLKIPGSVVPLVMDYSLKEEKIGIHVLRLKREVNDWLNVSGFKGLKLSSVELVASFPINEAHRDMSFEAKASLQFSKVNLNLSGVYSLTEFYLQTGIPECTIADIKQFYSDLTERQLEDFKHNILLKNLVLRVATSGLSFSGEITIDGHTSLKATLKIHRDGISITGSVEDIKLGEITVKKAELDVFIGRIEPNTTSRETGFEISGKVSFRGIDISVALYTTFEENQPVMWTVYGEIDGDLRLNRLAPDVKGTFLDLSLKQVAFIVTNQDSPVGDFNVFKYPIRRGVQFCAVIDRIRQLDQVSGGKVGGLVLRAAYSSARGFSFGVVLPAPVTFSFGPTLSSGPISLELLCTRNPQIIFTAALNVKVARQTQPLVFTFGLKADLDSAEGFGQMTNYWINPLGIGKRVKIGPDVALELGIIYAVLASTGTPSKIAFSGGLAIGGTEVQVAMAISENPLEQILKASLSKLSITDLVKFASDISGEEIPLPPEDLLAFRNVLFYISTGISIGTTYYPAGASIKADIQLFGRNTNVECTVGSTTKITALFDNVQVGPLLLTGVAESRPSLNIELGLMEQHIMVDGRLKLFDLDTSVHSVFEILPKPDMRFDLSFAFAEALDIEISARVVGAADFKNLKNADFFLSVILEQEILEYINNHVKAHFHAIQKALKDGPEAARKFFEAEKKRLNARMAKAKKVLNAVKVSWEAKEREVKDALEEMVLEFEEGILELQRKLEEAKKEFEAALYAAHQHLEQARIDRAAFITSAAIRVMRTRREFRAAIKAQLFDVRATKEETKSMYGALLQDLRDAEESYRQARDAYDESMRDLEESKRELEEAPFLSRVKHSFEVGHSKGHAQEAEADFLSASRKLAIAQEALESSGYQSAVAVKTAKVIELQSAKREEEAVMKIIQQDLEAETRRRNQKVEASKKAIEEQTAVANEKIALKKAQAELKEFKGTKQTAIKDLKTKLETLPQSSEFERLESATKDLKIVKGAARELEVAHEAVTGIEKEVARNGPKLKDIGEKIVETLESIFNIHRIELYGSLNDLVKKGQPLSARIQGVIAGIKVDFVLEYGIGKTLHFIRAMLWKLWDEVREGLMDGLEGDIEVEVKVTKTGKT